MLHIPDAGFISTLIVGISSSLYFSYISATNTFNTPANIITKTGFHFVFLSSTTLIAKISTMSHLTPSMLIIPLPQKAVQISANDTPLPKFECHYRRELACAASLPDFVLFMITSLSHKYFDNHLVIFYIFL